MPSVRIGPWVWDLGSGLGWEQQRSCKNQSHSLKPVKSRVESIDIADVKPTPTDWKTLGCIASEDTNPGIWGNLASHGQ